MRKQFIPCIVSLVLLLSQMVSASQPVGVNAASLLMPDTAQPPAGLSALEWDDILSKISRSEGTVPAAIISNQIKKLTADDGADSDQFGYSVAISGDTLVVGVPQADIDGKQDQGAVYVFSRDQGGAEWWGQVRKLTAIDGSAYDDFGFSVAISGDTLVVGADSAEINSKQRQGAAYVFSRNEGGAEVWGQVAKLSAADGVANEYFGRSVSISNDTVVVGVEYAEYSQGAAYVFSRDHGGAEAWGQVTKLTAADGAANDYFGYSVAISGDMLVVGANSAYIDGNENQGAAYVFSRNEGGAWGQVTKLTADDGTASDYFGESVAVNGDTLVVGAILAYIDGNLQQGAAYVFSRNEGGAEEWGQVTKLTADDGAAVDHFGCSVAISGDMLVVGADIADIDVKQGQGAVYGFARNQGGAEVWGQAAKLTADDGAKYDHFGGSVAISGNRLVVGVPEAYIDENQNQGAAYVYSLSQQVSIFLPLILK